MNHKNGSNNGSGTATAPARDSKISPEGPETIDPQRERRITDLRRQVQEGDYRVASDQVAKKIIDEHHR